MATESTDFTKVWHDAGGIAHDPARAGTYRRVVSIVPSLTETFCAVGGRGRLVGCCAFCIRPAGLLKDPAVVKVGGTKTVLRDKLLALKPDLLLLNLEENTLEDIDFFKPRVECYINGVKTLEEGIHTIRELGALLNTLPQAEVLAAQAEAELQQLRAAAKEKLKTVPHRPRLLYAIWKDPWMTINRDTFIDDHLQVCGAENVFAGRAERYPEVSIEEIVAAQPEVVWLPSEPYIFKAKHQAEFSKLVRVPATQTGRIELVDGDSACWFGVRQIEGMPITFRQLWK